MERLMSGSSRYGQLFFYCCRDSRQVSVCSRRVDTRAGEEGLMKKESGGRGGEEKMGKSVGQKIVWSAKLRPEG